MDKVQDKREWHFTIVENAVLFSSHLTTFEKIIYVILCAYANSETGECYPSIRTVAELAGVSENTVRKAVKGLEQKGLITIEYRKIGVKNDSNLYTIVNLPQWIRDEYEAIKTSSTSPGEGGTSPHEVGVLHQVNQGTSPGEDEQEPFNKKLFTSSCSSDPLAEIVNQYQKAGFGLPSPLQIEYLSVDLKKYGKEWVIEALAESDRRGKHRLDYVEGILENWKTKGKDNKSNTGEKKPNTRKSNRVKRPGGTFSNYDQRQYTPEELKQLENMLLGLDKPMSDDGG